MSENTIIYIYEQLSNLKIIDVAGGQTDILISTNGTSTPNSLLIEWISGSNFILNQGLTYNGKLYKAINTFNNSILNPSVDTTNFLLLNNYSNKADKVTPVVENNLLSMDSTGNLKDSGNKVLDFETPTGSQTKIDNSITLLKDGVNTDGDTLNKLRVLISGIQTLSTDITASNISVVDTDNNFTSIPKNVENILKELFQYASNGKTSVANVIGIPSVSTETFSQLTTDIQNIKNSFVTNLGSKGISSLSTDTLVSLVANILNITGGTGSSSIKNTKLNLTAPTTHVETLTNAITLQKLATSVLKYINGATGVVEYLSNFNNGDASNFTYPTSVVFDGTMHLIETPLNVITWDTGILVTGELYTSNLIDLTKFNSIETIIITDNTIPTIVINGTCSPTSVIANSDINLTGILDLAQIIWTTVVTGSGILKLAISIDSATTWQTFNGSTWITVDINNKVDFKANGMTPSAVNLLTKAQLELLRGNSEVIRFAYYLEKVNTSDVANNDSITLKVDMNGVDAIASQTDFSYSLGTDMKTITYTINTSGTYTFVYADS